MVVVDVVLMLLLMVLVDKLLVVIVDVVLMLLLMVLVDKLLVVIVDVVLMLLLMVLVDELLDVEPTGKYTMLRLELEVCTARAVAAAPRSY